MGAYESGYTAAEASILGEQTEHGREDRAGNETWDEATCRLRGAALIAWQAAWVKGWEARHQGREE